MTTKAKTSLGCPRKPGKNVIDGALTGWTLDFQETADMNKKYKPPPPNTMTNLGFCNNCAQPENHLGFTAFYDAVAGPNEEFQWWYCNWCGSNDVTIRDADGSVVWEHNVVDDALNGWTLDFQETADMNKKYKPPPPNTTTNLGFCNNCAQPEKHCGFTAFYDAVPGPNEEFHWWYCNWCGSNDVTIRDADGSVVWEHQ